ncbi:MAG: Flp pilus assembly complex ATPase component TadA [Candidatus Omnitrophica bacterium]|nr:Flp pilus assembly complex ATPase component TadA [Candidatus Omnitrophota bacterium]MBU4488000.1 Flp pilus assembly complex ATPase component TadA [Candidatus Omnitrophota bacterium]MCG2704757.1 Flp pilus assembly complex ATPase component TadA [Candidatus Omnitrophota bacterium]
MAKSLKDRLVEVLLDSKLITKEQLDKALKMQKKEKSNIGEVLVKEGFITQKDLMIILSRELNIPPMNLARYKISPDVIKLIPERIAKQYHLLPVAILGNTLTLAMSDPLNIFAIDDIRMLTKFDIDPVLATESDIKEAINIYYGTASTEMSQILEDAKEKEGELEVVEHEDIDISRLTEESKKAPIVKMVDLMLAEALKKRASDIHIEPCERELRIRYRIDGALHEALTLPKKNQNAVLARLKIMSKLDITESRLPQDGRFKIRLEGREVDFRVSVLPVSYGSKVVLRALDKSSLGVGLDKLGFLKEELERFEEGLKRPYGMLLLTGPTGCGKSTTLYSILNKLNTPEKNIITVEDPVEYQVEGITQIPVNADIGLTFSAGLRGLLRQSPDIIMVGEIRDFETADIAIKASLTGELVLSTLHTNDAPGAITRLIDMGVEPFLVASSIVLTAAQRLCRRICPHCKEEADIPMAVLERVWINKAEMDKLKGKKFFKGRGCPKCNNTGYYGRMGTLEVLIIDDAIRDMIIKCVPADQLKDYAVKHGMSTLRDNALKKFINGDTTLEEVLRITTVE